MTRPRRNQKLTTVTKILNDNVPEFFRYIQPQGPADPCLSNVTDDDCVRLLKVFLTFYEKRISERSRKRGAKKGRVQSKTTTAKTRTHRHSQTQSRSSPLSFGEDDPSLDRQCRPASRDGMEVGRTNLMDLSPCITRPTSPAFLDGTGTTDGMRAGQTPSLDIPTNQIGPRSQLGRQLRTK